MFAARTNQENAVYQQQQATAAKNKGVNGLAPKTPGYKAPTTPFKVNLNDENLTFGAGKTGGKGKDGLFGDGKGGKVDPSAFVTPAGMSYDISNITIVLLTINRTAQQSTTWEQDHQCQRKWIPNTGCTPTAGTAIGQANESSHAPVESPSPAIRTRGSRHRCRA